MSELANNPPTPHEALTTRDEARDNIALRLTNVGKCYRLYARLTDRLFTWLFPDRPRHFEFWSLRGVSFEVKRGEAFGIMGVNGAGKSSLLRVLCGVQDPSEGSIDVHGRITSLLNLMSGFHPDFSGRENIYFNCALRGLSRAETERIVETIIDFSELGTFIDKPVRTYSAGMQMRLGFSIAIAVDAEILVFDEVIGVGDGYFMMKCFRRLSELQAQGKTLVIATHNLDQLTSLCQRAVWLSRGAVQELGSAQRVANNYVSYLRSLDDHGEDPWAGSESGDARVRPATAPAAAPAVTHDTSHDVSHDVSHDTANAPATAASPGASSATPSARAPASPNDSAPTSHDTESAALHAAKTVSVIGVEILDAEDLPRDAFEHGETIVLRVTARSHEPLDAPVMGISLHRNDGVYVFGPNTMFDGVATGTLTGLFSFALRLDDCPLLPGEYVMHIGIYDRLHSVPLLRIDADTYRFRIVSDRRDHGLVRLNHSWHIARLAPANAEPGEQPSPENPSEDATRTPVEPRLRVIRG